MSSESKLSYGMFQKVVKFFNFGKGVPPEERISKEFRVELSQSPRALLVLVIGPSKAGKSTLLNFLTLKEYPLLNKRGKITKEAKEMAHFEVRGGDIPCTADFKYKKVKASEFMEMFNIEGVPAGADDFDIHRHWGPFNY